MVFRIKGVGEVLMKKLTKEQAEFLIDKVDRIFLMENKEALFNDKVVKIINECTEKEFPEIFKSHLGCEPDTIRVYHNSSTENDCDCEIELYTTTKFTHFTNEQFKQFAAGCSKVVEWLEGQEKDFS